MHRMFGWIRRGAGWALTIVSALSLLDCLLCMGMTLFGRMEVSSTGEAVGAFFGFALLAAVSRALLFLGWRMRGMGPVLMVPLRCRVDASAPQSVTRSVMGLSARAHSFK